MEKVTYKNILNKSYRIGLPIAIQTLILASVRLVDNLFVGHLENATHVSSGINAISNVSFILFTVISGFITGIGVFFTQASSNKNLEKQKEFFRIKIFITFILSFFLLSLAFIFLKQISKLWIANGPDQELAVNYAFDYGKYVIPTLAIDMFVLVFASSFIEVKKTKLTMFVAIIAIIINSSLNYPLMYTFHLGIEGSAIATMIARFAELLIWLIYIVIKKPEFMGKMRYWFFINWKTLKTALPKASIWAMNALLGTLAFSIQILLLSRTSISAGASMIIAGTFSQLIFAFVSGYTQAAGILLSYEITKNDPNRFRDFVHRYSHISIMFSLICGGLLVSLIPLINIIYPKYEASTLYDSKVMIVSLAVSISFNVVFSVYSSSLKAAGYSKLLIIIDSSLSWLFSVGLTFILTEVNTGISFGYIYFIVGSTQIFKALASWWMFELKWKTLKPIINPI